MALIWPGVILASGATPSILSFFHGIESKSLYEYVKSNSAALLNLVFPLLALVVNISVKIYSDRLHQQMNNLDTVYVVFGNKTVMSHKEDEKFSFSMGLVVAFPASLFLTFLTSFGSRHIRLLLFIPTQLSIIDIAIPCFIICNNNKIKQRAFNQFSSFAETIDTCWKSFLKLKTQRISPTNVHCWRK